MVAVCHGAYLESPREGLIGRIFRGDLLNDVKSIFPPKSLPEHLTYWSL